MPSVEAIVIARLFIDEIISRHGTPRVLLPRVLLRVLPRVLIVLS